MKTGRFPLIAKPNLTALAAVLAALLPFGAMALATERVVMEALYIPQGGVFIRAVGQCPTYLFGSAILVTVRNVSGEPEYEVRHWGGGLEWPISREFPLWYQPGHAVHPRPERLKAPIHRRAGAVSVADLAELRSAASKFTFNIMEFERCVISNAEVPVVISGASTATVGQVAETVEALHEAGFRKFRLSPVF